MTHQPEEEGIHSYVRNMINQNKVRLWEPPFYENNKVNDEEMLKLSLNLAPSSEISQEKIIHSLFHLQNNALDKLASRKVFKETGKNILKMKYPKSLSECNAQLPKTVEIITEETTGEDLVSIIGSNMGDTDRRSTSIKLISGGKVLGSEKLNFLSPGATVMVVPVDAKNESLRLIEEQNRILKSTKHDADLLKDDDRLQIGDQSGKSLNLPKEEKKALIMAMSLHEKAKISLKKKDFSLALVFLLEAHREYQNCSPSILESVDNFGLLNLDIAWCYLNLEHLNELPQADQRLAESEFCFNRIYGKDLERQKNAKVLHARLHLLQGVVAYHKGDLHRARSIFKSVQQELDLLFVPSDLIEELVALGYQESESRMALRVCDKNVPQASLHINAKREQRKKIIKEEREEKKRDKKRKALGKTADGKGYVNLGYYNTMMNMGFPENLTGLALRQCNNDMGLAIDSIQNNPELLLLADEENKSKKRKIRNISDDDIVQIASMGFDDLVAVRKVLKKHNGDVERAVQSLMNHENISSDDDSDEAEATREFYEKKKKSDEAYSRMKEDLSDMEEEYLDLTLEEETQILERYIRYLSNN
ncbi:NEDD8 ultimate buster 1 [Lepeophtheirus salmonis]|nr:NEDD8 ultimate buster 1-like isoform X1 [Lepeophtheirus salmonis]